MALPLPAELRLAAQALILQGFSCRVAGEKIGVREGTVRKWMVRGNWEPARDMAKADCVMAVKSVAADALAKTNEFVRESLAGSIAHVATKLSERRPKSLKAAMAQQAKLEATVRNAKAVFGWREGNEGSPIRINVMANAVQLNTGQPSIGQPSNEPPGGTIGGNTGIVSSQKGEAKATEQPGKAEGTA